MSNRWGPIVWASILAVAVGLLGALMAFERYNTIHSAFRPCAADFTNGTVNCPTGDYTSVWIIAGASGGLAAVLLLFVIIAAAVRVGMRSQ